MADLKKQVLDWYDAVESGIRSCAEQVSPAYLDINNRTKDQLALIIDKKRNKPVQKAFSAKLKGESIYTLEYTVDILNEHSDRVNEDKALRESVIIYSGNAEVLSTLLRSMGETQKAEAMDNLFSTVGYITDT